MGLLYLEIIAFCPYVDFTQQQKMLEFGLHIYTLF